MIFVFDIGGTKMRLAKSTDGKGLSDVIILPTPQKFDDGMEQIGQVFNQFGTGDPVLVAGGVAGTVDTINGIVLKSPHLTDWENKPLGKRISEITNSPVTLENDTVIGGLGEAIYGAGKDFRIVGYVSIGTGVGGSKIVDGKADAKTYGFEPGHQIICDDDRFKFWEEFVSGSAMEKIFNKKPEEIDDAKIWEDQSKLVAVGIYNCIMMWSPEVMILNGSISKRLDIEKIKNYIKEMNLMYPVLPEIRPAGLGDDSGLYGALTLIK